MVCAIMVIYNKNVYRISCLIIVLHRNGAQNYGSELQKIMESPNGQRYEEERSPSESWN